MLNFHYLGKSTHAEGPGLQWESCQSPFSSFLPPAGEFPAGQRSRKVPVVKYPLRVVSEPNQGNTGVCEGNNRPGNKCIVSSSDECTHIMRAAWNLMDVLEDVVVARSVSLNFFLSGLSHENNMTR